MNAERFQDKDPKTIKCIIDNYVQNEKALVNQLYFKTTHGTTIGSYREEIWKGMFEQIIPKKFVIEQSVFIIDSGGRVSKEVDLAIFDETYTPYIFRYGKLKFLPIEAVAVVVECKSTSFNTEKLREWAESISGLRTSRESYTRINRFISIGLEEKGTDSTQSATRPLRILCCLDEKDSKKNPVNACFSEDNSEKLFDFILRASDKAQALIIEADKTKETLKAWYQALNHADPEQMPESINEGDDLKELRLSDYEITDDKDKKMVSLLTFNLQLNQLLMLINNPIWFPHKAYVNMFNTVGKKEMQ